MSSETYDLLASEVQRRRDDALIADMDRMALIYEGELPHEFDRFFPSDTPKQIVNLIRLAWDDLATQVGRLPELRGEALNNTDKEEKRVALLESIGMNYLRNAEPNAKIAMRSIAFWLIGVGRAVAVVTPNNDRKMPVISYRDPRTAFPNPRRTVGNQIIELEDLMFQYELSADEMKNRGLKMRETSGFDPVGHQTGKVIEFIDRERWLIVSEGGTVRSARHGLDMVPGWVFNTFSPNKAAISQFQDQVVFMVAISRMLSQKLRFGDRLAHPLLWVKGHEGTINVGPEILTKLGPQGEMGAINPPTQLQVDRDIASLERFSRILNRNPEARQGEVQSKGTYMSAKTLEQLAESIDTVVGGFWDIISVGMGHILAACYRMDEKFWPDTEKSLSGIRQKRGRKVFDSYIPSRDIAGRYQIGVDYGFGMGGYQGFLMQVQMVGSKLQSRRGALEEMPGTHDVDDKMREIELEQVDDAVIANFQSKAAQGGLDIVVLSKLRKQMAEEGRPLFDVILDYEQELADHARQAMDQGGAEPLTAASTPEQAPAPQPPGIPPSAALGM
jgi:hypothetical protein